MKAVLEGEGRTLKVHVGDKPYLKAGGTLKVHVSREIFEPVWSRELEVTTGEPMEESWEVGDLFALPGRYGIRADHVPAPLEGGSSLDARGYTVAMVTGKSQEFQARMMKEMMKRPAPPGSGNPGGFCWGEDFLEIRPEDLGKKDYLEAVLGAEALLDGVFRTAGILLDRVNRLRASGDPCPEPEGLGKFASGLEGCRALFPGSVREASLALALRKDGPPDFDRLQAFRRQLLGEAVVHRLLVIRALARSLAQKKDSTAWDREVASAKKILELWATGLSPRFPVEHLQKVLELKTSLLAWIEAQENRRELDLKFADLWRRSEEIGRILEDPLDPGGWSSDTPLGALTVRVTLERNGRSLKVRAEGCKPGLLAPGARVLFQVWRNPGSPKEDLLPGSSRDLVVSDALGAEASWSLQEGFPSAPARYRITARQHGPIPAATPQQEAEAEKALKAGSVRAGFPEWASPIRGEAEFGIGTESPEYLESLLKAESYLKASFSEMRALTDRMMPFRDAYEEKLASADPEGRHRRDLVLDPVLLHGEDVMERGLQDGKKEDLAGVPEEWKALHAQAVSTLERLVAGQKQACGEFFPGTRKALLDPKTLRTWRSPGAVLLAQMLGRLPMLEDGEKREKAMFLTDGHLEPWAKPLAGESLACRVRVLEDLSVALDATTPESREAFVASARGTLDLWSGSLKEEPRRKELIELRTAFLSRLEDPGSVPHRTEFERRLKGLEPAFREHAEKCLLQSAP